MLVQMSCDVMISNEISFMPRKIPSRVFFPQLKNVENIYNTYIGFTVLVTQQTNHII